MAKPKSPRKNTGMKDTVSAAGTPPAAPEVNGVATEAVSAASPDVTAETTTKKIAERKLTRKPEIVKSDARATLVPINLEEEIRALAYLFSERRGFTPGHEAEDWLAAEHEVLERYHQHQHSA